MATIEIQISEVNEAMDKLFRKQDEDGKEQEYIANFPLHAAVEAGCLPHKCIRQVESLLKKGVEIDEIDWFGCTPLTYAVIKTLQHAIWSHGGVATFTRYRSWQQIVKMLIEHGANSYKMSLPLESVVVPPPRYDIYGIVENIHGVLEKTPDSPLKKDITELYSDLQPQAIAAAEEALNFGAAEEAAPVSVSSMSKPELKRSSSSSSSDSDRDGYGIRNVKKRKRKKNTRRRKRCRMGTRRNRKTGKCIRK